MIQEIFNFFERLIHQPMRILAICGLLIFYSVILDGTIFQMRKLYLSRKSLNQKMQEIKIKNQTLIDQLEKLSDPSYLEKEARDRFDLVNQGDLIFIFPEDE